MKKMLAVIGLMSGLILFGACNNGAEQAASQAPTKQKVTLPVTRMAKSSVTAGSVTAPSASSTSSSQAVQIENIQSIGESSSVSTAQTAPVASSTAAKVSSSAGNIQARSIASTIPSHEGGPAGEQPADFSNDRSDLNNAGTSTTQPESTIPSHEGGPAGEQPADFPNDRSDLNNAGTSTTQPESTIPSHEGGPAGEQPAEIQNNRSDLNQPVPADLLNAYRTTISEAGQNGATFTDEQLTVYFNEGVQYGDSGTLLQLVARDRGIPFQELLNNYYRYHGQNSDGSEAVLSADQLQAYRNVIALAGVDAASFSADQLNGYFHEAHLSGDFGTLLRFVARDRGLNADQLVATYLENSK